MCDLDDTGAPSTLRVIISDVSLTRMLPTFRNGEEKAARLKWNWTLVDYASGTPEAAKKRSVSR